MNVLVTGGAGFVGSHVCERLIQLGHEVVILDDLNDFYDPALKQANLHAIEGVGPMIFHKGDIRDVKLVNRLVDEHRPDAIVHLAARAGVRPSVSDPLLYEDVNVRGTLILLEAARKFLIRRMVFASSSSVYGIAERVPFREDEALTFPISPYAATKIAGEKLCFTYSHLFGIDAVCLRFFTVYGPRQRPDLAIRAFTAGIDRGQPIRVFGNGSSSRDYTYVEDTVQAVISALTVDCRFDVFNVGNSRPVDLMTVIRTIETHIGKQALIEWVPPQPGDVSITYSDIAKAQRILGYSPTTPLEHGIRKFVEWYVSQRRTGEFAYRSRVHST